MSAPLVFAVRLRADSMSLRGRFATMMQLPSWVGAMHPNPSSSRQPWNKRKIVGQKSPLKLKEVWATRIRLQLAKRTRDLALFCICSNDVTIRNRRSMPPRSATELPSTPEPLA